MRKFVITSSNFEGGINLAFDAEGKLVKFETEAVLSDEKFNFFMNNMPRHMDKLDYFRTLKSVKVVEVITEISFEDFYEQFGNKVGKLKAQNAWKQLSRAEQVRAYSNIIKYKNYLKLNPGIAHLYPATYLNQKRWND